MMFSCGSDKSEVANDSSDKLSDVDAALFFFLEVLSFDRIRWKPLSPLSEVATGLRHHEAKLNSIKKGSAAAVSKH